jgi:hypothetical protein
MRKEIKVGGYTFGLCCTKATYKKMSLQSKTYQALNFIKYNPFCTRAEVQRFIYGNKKYSSYGSFVWKNLLADSLIQKTDGRFYGRFDGHVVYYITPHGEAFLEEINRNNIYKNK